LEVDGGLTVDHGHAIADATEAAVENLLPGTIDATTHLKPLGINDDRLDPRISPLSAL
jgi:divalent metal cation (Fe/Co/Zn/Cd) transporter